MIRPPLPRVKNGDVLGLGLMNGIINRIEYAADLLRQGRPLEGNQISILQSAIGSKISFRVSEEIISTFRAVFGNAFIYDPQTNEFTTVGGNFNWYGISGKNLFGYRSDQDVGVTYDGQNITEIVFGGSTEYNYTRIYGGNENIAVGEYYQDEGQLGSVFGFSCDLYGGNFIQVKYPPSQIPSGTYDSQIMFLGDIFENKIIGEATLRNTVFQSFNKFFLLQNYSSFIDLPHSPNKIHGDYITMDGGRIYKISTQQTTVLQYNGIGTQTRGIYNNLVSGTVNGGSDFLYNIDTDTFEFVDYFAEDLG
jgi:hypothetical protein